MPPISERDLLRIVYRNEIRQQQAAGHFVTTCYSAEEAIKVIEEYCELMNHKMGDIEIVIPLKNREALRNITMSIPNNSILKDGKVKGDRP